MRKDMKKGEKWSNWVASHAPEHFSPGKNKPCVVTKNTYSFLITR